jgi:predicted DNA-binding protein YlxM (UPF0122 family)
MGKIYSKKDNEYLINNYLTTSSKELAEKIGVSKEAIKSKIKRLGLIKTIRIKKNEIPLSKRSLISIGSDLSNYLFKKKKDFAVGNVDTVIRKIVKEWIAFKRIERERKSTTNNNINTQAHE